VLHASAVKFGATTLAQEIGSAAGAKWRSAPAQVRYLAAYLADREIGARTMLVETPYVDRHYLQEYVGYYATKLVPPPRNATRIHFWKRSFDTEAWNALLLRAAVEGVAAVGAELQPDYLGYVVVRPFAACPIGRTLLATYRDRSSRCYAPALTPHEVHLQGFTFHVNALPFQQQDEGLGACATTALWSSLARATRADGGRAATPLDVARAASDAGGQLVAAPDGLDLDSMKRTFRQLGYVPHVFVPADHEVFLLALKAYVRAGIAVVLRLRVEGTSEVHAVAVAGMRESDDEFPEHDLVVRARDFQVAATRPSRLYLHDDRLGPYARFVFVAPSDEELRSAREEEHAPPLRVRFDPQKGGFEEYTEPMRIESAIVPLYPKVRTSAEGLVAYAGDYVPLVRMAAPGPQREALRIEPQFMLGGQYLAMVGEVLRDPARLTKLRSTALLSRYVGVIRFSLPDGWLCDLVIDTTDVRREQSGTAPILLAVGRDEPMATTLENTRQVMDASFLVV
jgi:hypothetical protein